MDLGFARPPARQISSSRAPPFPLRDAPILLLSAGPPPVYMLMGFAACVFGQCVSLSVRRRHATRALLPEWHHVCMLTGRDLFARACAFAEGLCDKSRAGTCVRSLACDGNSGRGQTCQPDLVRCLRLSGLLCCVRACVWPAVHESILYVVIC